MNNQLVDILRCPRCLVQLKQEPKALRCEKDPSHAFACDGSYIAFDPSIDQGKYDEDYSNRYAFLWAYGYESRHSGLVESLYRSVAALVAEALVATHTSEPVFVDVGCGTGRSTSDAAKLAPQGRFLGVDASRWKLNLAAKILMGTENVERALPRYGFSNPLRVRGRGLANVVLAQADAASLPLDVGTADIVLCVNLLDRVASPKQIVQEARRVLRQGGTLIVSTPLNWNVDALWGEYPDATHMLKLLQDCDFRVQTWFDQLQYRETLDARGSVEEFTTLVLSARTE